MIPIALVCSSLYLVWYSTAGLGHDLFLYSPFNRYLVVSSFFANASNVAVNTLVLASLYLRSKPKSISLRERNTCGATRKKSKGITDAQFRQVPAAGGRVALTGEDRTGNFNSICNILLD